MHMAIAARQWTVEEVWALPDDGNRYEVIDGELLVTPSPRSHHQDGVLELAATLREYLRNVPVGRAYASPADIRYGPRTMVQPDVFVAPFIEGRRPRGWNEMRHLLVAVEVLSPSSARSDRTIKRALYQREGVPEYWIVDVDARLIERWTPGDSRPEIVTAVLRWQPDPEQPAFELDLDRYFAEVIGES